MTLTHVVIPQRLSVFLLFEGLATAWHRIGFRGTLDDDRSHNQVQAGVCYIVD